MKVYLDNCCFNRPYDTQDNEAVYLESEAKLFIQDRIKGGKLELIRSYMLSYENSENPDPNEREAIASWAEIAVSNVTESPQLLQNGHRLIKLGFHAKDALHLACAMDAESDFFLTTDKGILRDGYKVIFEKLDLVEGERFIALIQRDKFDYTRWRETLFSGIELEELSRLAMEYQTSSQPDRSSG